MESLLKVGQWGIACDAGCTYVLYFDSGISIRQSQVNAFADDDKWISLVLWCGIERVKSSGFGSLNPDSSLESNALKFSKF